MPVRRLTKEMEDRVTSGGLARLSNIHQVKYALLVVRNVTLALHYSLWNGEAMAGEMSYLRMLRSRSKSYRDKDGVIISKIILSLLLH